MFPRSPNVLSRIAPLYDNCCKLLKRYRWLPWSATSESGYGKRDHSCKKRPNYCSNYMLPQFLLITSASQRLTKLCSLSLLKQLWVIHNQNRHLLLWYYSKNLSYKDCLIWTQCPCIVQSRYFKLTTMIDIIFFLQFAWKKKFAFASIRNISLHLHFRKTKSQPWRDISDRSKLCHR